MVLISEEKTLKKAFTVEEFYRLGEVGILGEDDRVELIEGDIFYMAPIGSRHAICVLTLTVIFSERLNKRALPLSQNPISINNYNLPQPDLALIQLDLDTYRKLLKHPEPKDIALVIEVSDSTIRHDREKGVVYAQAGIREYWLINLKSNEIEVYRNPTPEGYQHQQIFKPGESVSPLAFPDLVILIEDILP